MSQHPSLRSRQKGKKYRSVLKRYERIKELKEKEKWKEGDSVFGLLKLKILKFKLKKEKVAPASESAEMEKAQPKEAQQPVEGIKDTQATMPKKEATKKEEEKKK